eukprot:s1246_g1.t1
MAARSRSPRGHVGHVSSEDALALAMLEELQRSFSDVAERPFGCETPERPSGSKSAAAAGPCETKSEAVAPAAGADVSNPLYDDGDCEVGEGGQGQRQGFQRGLCPPALSQANLDDVPILAWREPLLRRIAPAFQDAVFLRPVKVSSACTGTGAARLALQWTGCPMEENFACDPKKAALKFNLGMGMQPKHFFNTAADVARGQGHCHVHGRHCDLGEEGKCDLMVAGFPCQPFSVQRPQRWSEGWRKHLQAPVMEEVCQAIKATLPRLVVLENVMGFLRTHRTAFRVLSSQLFCAVRCAALRHCSIAALHCIAVQHVVVFCRFLGPLATLLSYLNGEDGEDFQYLHAVTHIDSACFLEGSRQRMYLLLAHKDVKNAEALLETAQTLVRTIQEQVALQETPFSLSKLLLPAGDPYLAEQFAAREARTPQVMFHEVSRE